MEDLKRELLKIGPNWEFNVECPVHKIPLYARGYGHAIADWGKHWKKGESLLFPEGTDIPIVIAYNIADKCSDYVARVIGFSQSYEMAQRRNTEARAELTRKLGLVRPERQQARKKLKEEALDHKSTLLPVEGLRWIADYLCHEFIKPERHFQNLRIITNCLRCAAGDFINIDMLISRVYGKRVFIFLRELTDNELRIAHNWESRKDTNKFIHIPNARSMSRLALAAEIESRIDSIKTEAIAK